MKTTAICKFDGTAVLIVDYKSLDFNNYEALENYCKENGIKIEISHWHPASGLRMERVNHG